MFDQAQQLIDDYEQSHPPSLVMHSTYGDRFHHPLNLLGMFLQCPCCRLLAIVPSPIFHKGFTIE